MAYAIRGDGKGRYAGQRETFKSAGNIVALASVAPFLIISGVANKTIRITRIKITGLTLTAAQYLRVALSKYSTAATVGTPAAATIVPLDSAGVEGTPANINTYAGGAPTPGTLVGEIAERTIVAQATGVLGTDPIQEVDFQSMFTEESYPIVLHSVAEQIGILFPVAPATAVTLSYEIEFTQDGN